MCKIVGGNCIITIHWINRLRFTWGDNFLVTSVTFLTFFENNCSFKLSMGIIVVQHGTSNTKK